MLKHIHHMRAADPLRVIDPCLGKPPAFQVDDPSLCVVDHILLCAEHDRSGGTGLDAGRLQAHCHPVGAEGALVDLAVLLRQAGDVERAAGDAVAAADAVFLVEIHDAVAVLDDGARRRAGLEAARVGAVHAAVLADQPFQAPVGFHFGVAHHRPGVFGQVHRVVVDAVVGADCVAGVVPLHARHLAGLAADAFRDVDQLGHLLGLARAGRAGWW